MEGVPATIGGKCGRNSCDTGVWSWSSPTGDRMLLSEPAGDPNEVGAAAETRPLSSGTLYHFTLAPYYERTIERLGVYRPPEGQPLHCAATREQLQWLVEIFDPTAFPEEDRAGSGLLLFIDVEQMAPVFERGQEPEAPLRLLQAIPREAIVETRKIPQKEVRFPLPIDLDLEPPRDGSRVRRIATALSASLYVYLVALLVGLFLGVFPARFPSEGATRWITFFLNNGSVLSVAAIAALFAAGGIFLILPLARLQFGIEKGDAQVVPIQNLFGIIRPLDPGPKLISSRMLAGLGLTFFVASVAGLWIWYTSVEIDTVEFEVRQLGMEARQIASGQIVTVPQGTVLEISVLLPPHLGNGSCSWETSAATGIIRQGTSNCQAVYDPRSTTGSDFVVVTIHGPGRVLLRGSFTVRSES